MPSVINKAIYKIVRRAEKLEKQHLLNTFVDVGPLFALLRNTDHQIIYGRRGTGKTHALSILQAEIENSNFVSVYIDMRNIGSNGGMYTDYSLRITERATRLLIDTFSIIHDQILDYVLLHDEDCDLSKFGPLLDELGTSISEIEVVGDIELEQTSNSSTLERSESGLTASTKDIGVHFKDEGSSAEGKTYRRKIQGTNRHRVHVTTINSIFSRIGKLFEDKEIWILIDEWAEVPLDLQPYLADLLRRTLFSLRGVTIKIAAIEKRTNFKIDSNQSYIGIETGADISASLNLDEFMVFDNDPEKSKSFFKSLLFNHANEFLKEEGIKNISKENFISSTFTQTGAFEEIVRASEGIPRDAINILIQSAIKADNDKIAIPHIRAAAKKWFDTDKENSIISRIEAKLLLRYIIDEVIGVRKSRAFLISSDIQDSTIEYLFDNRILHLIKQNISSKDNPGERYNVYTIDYGTYVHLINTTYEPKGLFVVETDDGEIFTDVPLNDYRSIRRAVLQIEEYKKSYAQQVATGGKTLSE